MTRGVPTLLCLLVYATLAHSAPVTTVLNNGPADNRVDIAILGDGYTTAELADYAADVQALLGPFFAEVPFNTYAPYMNVHRVDVVSPQSGADHPELGVMVETALGATYNCAGIQRLICVDHSAVNRVLADSLPAVARDVVIVLVNDPEYGGSGGSIAVASTHPSVVELVLHELGHSFGLLADEYTTQPPTCNATVEPSEPNATRADAAPYKWQAWIDATTPLPTTGTAPGVPGLYEGAKYCPTGLYRPTDNSKMRSLGVPYEQINTEQLVKRLYNWVSPIDAASPVASSVTIPSGGSLAFSVTTPAPTSHALEVTWRVNGVVEGTGSVLAFDTKARALGPHTVEATVHDPTALVRQDPSGLLTDTRTWQVTISGQPGLALAVNQSTFGPGQTLTATITTQGSAGLDLYVGAILPDGDQLLLLRTLSPLGGEVVRLGSTNPAVFPKVTAGPQPTQTFSHTFTGMEAPGTYHLVAALVPPGAFNDGIIHGEDLVGFDWKAISLQITPLYEKMQAIRAKHSAQ